MIDRRVQLTDADLRARCNNATILLLQKVRPTGFDTLGREISLLNQSITQ